jgi:hypothetical protein
LRAFVDVPTHAYEAVLVRPLDWELVIASFLFRFDEPCVSAKLRNSVGFDDESREVLSYLEYGRAGKSRAGLFQATQHLGWGWLESGHS